MTEDRKHAVSESSNRLPGADTAGGSPRYGPFIAFQNRVVLIEFLDAGATECWLVLLMTLYFTFGYVFPPRALLKSSLMIWLWEPLMHRFQEKRMDSFTRKFNFAREALHQRSS